MIESNVEFIELPIPSGENQRFRIFYVSENKKSQVMNGFQNMPDERKDEIKTLIIKMATVNNFMSPKIRWHLKTKYKYGELKPKGHRFFFFINENNIIFFRYSEKKADSLGDKFYKNIEKLKRRYDNEFKKRI